MSAPQKRVWVAQCLCPQRHAILSAGGEAEDQSAAEEALIKPLRTQVTRMIGPPAEEKPPAPSPMDIIREACRRLELKPREARILLECLYARSQVSNGHLLISPGRVPAARRMMERGYLAQSKEQPVPFDPKGFGLVGGRGAGAFEQANHGRQCRRRREGASTW
jgi:hypothetical protein